MLLPENVRGEATGRQRTHKPRTTRGTPFTRRVPSGDNLRESVAMEVAFCHELRAPQDQMDTHRFA